MVGIGAATSNAIGGTLIQHLGYHASFLGLAGIALIAFVLLWFTVPETLSNNSENLSSRTGTKTAIEKESFA